MSKNRIKQVEKEISYLKRKMKVCAYGKAELLELIALENELTELKGEKSEQTV